MSCNYNFRNSHLWNGVFFVRTGLLKNGIFRFTLELDDDYPNTSNAPVTNFNFFFDISMITNDFVSILLDCSIPTENSTSIDFK